MVQLPCLYHINDVDPGGFMIWGAVPYVTYYDTITRVQLQDRIVMVQGVLRGEMINILHSLK